MEGDTNLPVRSEAILPVIGSLSAKMAWDLVVVVVSSVVGGLVVGGDMVGAASGGGLGGGDLVDFWFFLV